MKRTYSPLISNVLVPVLLLLASLSSPRQHVLASTEATGCTTSSPSSGLAAGHWLSIDVTPYITGEGTYSLAVAASQPSGINFASRESGTNAPQLIVELGQ